MFFEALIVHGPGNAGVLADEFEGIMGWLPGIVWFVFRDGYEPLVLSGFIWIVG